MADTKIAKKRLGEFLAALSEDYAVYGPKDDAGIVAFGRIGSPDELMLDYRNSAISPKELFLPRAETVYEFDGKGFADDALEDQKRIIFAMRPCDCRALTLLDRIFDTEQVKDPFYVTRRTNTVVVALGCDRPLRSCFCTAVGGNPHAGQGADVLLSDAGDSLEAKVITEKGKEFLARYKKFCSPSAGGNWAARAKKAVSKIKSDLPEEDIRSRLDDLFENDIWEAVSRKCIGCGACSYLCPTCYCFDLTDEKTPGGVRKIRTWDCCMFPSFTLHASGHNPRAVNAARLRQKVMHKFSYYTGSYGENGCVGCGRCIRSCPVNLDIRELLKQLTAAPEAAAQK